MIRIRKPIRNITDKYLTKFLSNPFVIRVPLFLIFTLKQKRGKTVLLRNLEKEAYKE